MVRAGDLKGGKKLHQQLFEAIQIHDRLLIVLSEHSIQSEWVMTEIRKAREAEKKEKRRKLFPIPPTRAPSIAAISPPTCSPLEPKPAMKIPPVTPLALSVKLSVRANADSRKFWRFNPNSL